MYYRSEDHPDRREGEVWLTNSTENGFHEISWETKRRSFAAYNVYGHLIPFSEGGIFPVFVQSSELNKARVVVS